MKNKLNKYYIKTISARKYTINHINAMASVKGGRALIGVFVNLLPVTGLQTTCARVRSIVVFLKLVSFLFRNNGAKGACLILKVYAVTLQQAVGGHVVEDLTELKFRISRTNRGLPRCIPVQHRQSIRAGDIEMVKFYLTLFNLYRVIEFKGDFRLSSLSKTIVSPAKTLVGFVQFKAELLAFVPKFFNLLKGQIGMNARSLGRELMVEYENAKAFPLLKSSPFTYPLHKLEDLSRSEQTELMQKLPVSSTHPIAVHEAANALYNNIELQEPTLYFLGLLPQNSSLRLAFFNAKQVPLIKGTGTQKSFTPTLGKLSLKEESAGKVRVFAMVDCWTQWLLKPLHDLIFDHILPGIPQDGTKDQLAPIHALLKRDSSSLFSLDLSAATDRLPIWLQEAIVAGFAGKEFASYWAQFLVNRDYVLTLTNKNNDTPVRYKLRYAVGQPMGAYSSWAMLALTHHMIVQFSAHMAYGKGQWFPAYAILGDDIVIGDAEVAKAYLKVMATLGVGIGLHKSLISAAGTALEFAKRTFYLGQAVSPVPITEWIAALTGPSCAVEFIKKYNLTLAAFLKCAGFGFNVLGRLQKPLGRLNAKVRLVILALNIPITPEQVEDFFSLGMPKSGRALFETVAVIDQMVEKEFRLLKAALNKMRLGLFSLEGEHLHSVDRAKELLTRVKGLEVKPGTVELIEDAFLTEVLPALGGKGKEDLRDPRLNIEKMLILVDPRGNAWVAERQMVKLTALESIESYPGDTKLFYCAKWLELFQPGKIFNGALLEFLRDLADDLSNRDLAPDTGTFIGMDYKVTAGSYLRTLATLYEAEALKPLTLLMKELQLLTQADIKVKAQYTAQTVSDTLVQVMLSKYDVTAKELFISLISLSKMIGKIPMANLSYARVIDMAQRGFTDGMHIRLWKSLSGLAQGTKVPGSKVTNQEQSPTFKTEKSAKMEDPNLRWFL
nr:MAG: RNA-dependent RNA polymerase [Rhizoctonia solani mitovirus 83]